MDQNMPIVPAPKATNSMRLIIILIICLLLLGGIFYFFKPQIFQSKGSAIELSAGFPTSMPQDIILVDDAIVKSTYTGFTSDGRQQSTLIYSTQSTSTDLIIKYRGYLSKNGWYPRKHELNYLESVLLVSGLSDLANESALKRIIVNAEEVDDGSATISINLIE